MPEAMYVEFLRRISNLTERVRQAFVLISYIIIFTVTLLSYEWNYNVKAIFSSLMVKVLIPVQFPIRFFLMFTFKCLHCKVIFFISFVGN